MNNTRKKLEEAEQRAKDLFNTIEALELIVPGKTEKQLNDEVIKVATEVYDIKEFWHKKIVRAGVNTMQPYGGNPPDVAIQDNDIVILDFGPVVDGYESDLARSYTMGNNTAMRKLISDVENAWQRANAWYAGHKSLTGAEFYQYIIDMTAQYGYIFGGEIAGHIVGPYPHEQLGADNWGLDIHPNNDQDMFAKDPQGNDRHWILEMHFIDKANNIGAFFEQLITKT